MPQHRCEQGLIYLAVVSPSGGVAVVFLLVCLWDGWIVVVDLALTGPGRCIGAEAGIAEVFQFCCDAGRCGGGGWLLSRIGAAEQIPLQG
ncbi:hypothetical protein [Synechococcus sp. UW179B]|uniref:hypothetical protein n=1 Tax=Synechococcus sp. UW179B TaxID=2575516 RepID=UPI001FCAF361|nr:hypothetical protein [Synechococcus sp. UW179B]